MISNGDECSACHKRQMPPWLSPHEKARACQACGYVEERYALVKVESEERSA